MNHLDVLTLKANADKFNIAFKQVKYLCKFSVTNSFKSEHCEDISLTFFADFLCVLRVANTFYHPKPE